MVRGLAVNCSGSSQEVLFFYRFYTKRCSDMYAKAAKTMAFYAKTRLNLLDVFMTNYTSIYYEKANSCCFYVVNSKKTLVLCVK